MQEEAVGGMQVGAGGGGQMTPGNKCVLYSAPSHVLSHFLKTPEPNPTADYSNPTTRIDSHVHRSKLGNACTFDWIPAPLGTAVVCDCV